MAVAVVEAERQHDIVVDVGGGVRVVASLAHVAERVSAIDVTVETQVT
jgi:hypothetical protein